MGEVDYDEIRDFFTYQRANYGQRNAEYDLARQRYMGVLWDAATNPVPPDRYSLHLNYLKPVVDKSIQLLVGRLPAVQVMPNGTDENARRDAEGSEGVIYATWDANDARQVFYEAAFNSFVLRRGLVYYWWDAQGERVRFKSCQPDNFYPEYDGHEISRAIYVHRRLTRALQEEYPDEAAMIVDDPGMDMTAIYGQDQARLSQVGYTTVIDYYEKDGTFARVMGRAMVGPMNLNYKEKEVPFIDFPCFVVGGEVEPINIIDQIVELNQYLCQLVSQKADIIKKYSNPTIVDYGSGQTAEAVRQAIQADGAVIPAKVGSKIELLTWNGDTPGIDEQMQFVIDSLFDLSGKPRSSYGQTITNQSGVVTNLALTPTLQSNEYHETVWGQRLSLLNERILQLWESFAAGSDLSYQGYVPSGKDLTSMKYRSSEIAGASINGWYKNRIKWPSAIRTDDPAYVQNDLAQLTSDPPAISLYTSLENRGVEDVEAEIDRIQEELMDPRLHPERLDAALNATTQMMGGGPQGSMGAPAPAGGGTTGQQAPPQMMDSALTAGGYPSKP